MKVETTNILDVLLITPRRFVDNRGFFSETWNATTLSSSGVDLPEFVQDNHSMSYDAGTIRGLHFQSPPHAQGKLVRCGRGAIFDVVVDIRKGSPTFGRWFGWELSFENGKQLWIPPGLLHGFMTLQQDSEIIYKCTEYYSPEHDGVVRWDSCGISWPIEKFPPILSKRDATAKPFADLDSPFIYRCNV